MLIFALMSTQSTFPTGLFTTLGKMEAMGILPADTTLTLLKLLVIIMIPSLVYIFAFFLLYFAGKAMRYFNQLWVEVELNQAFSTPKVYPQIVHEDADFVYLENSDPGDYWEAIRKDDIKTIRQVHHEPKWDNYKVFMSRLWQNDKRMFGYEVFKVILIGAMCAMVLIPAGIVLKALLF